MPFHYAVPFIILLCILRFCTPCITNLSYCTFFALPYLFTVIISEHNKIVQHQPPLSARALNCCSNEISTQEIELVVPRALPNRSSSNINPQGEKNDKRTQEHTLGVSNRGADPRDHLARIGHNGKHYIFRRRS